MGWTTGDALVIDAIERLWWFLRPSLSWGRYVASIEL
jgi:hypothetical protein